GRLTYLSGRSIEGKKHYNPPREIIGERHPYYNHVYRPDTEQLVVVEGQADAISFAEWGVPALAIGGVQLSDNLLRVIGVHPRVFVALDNTEEASEKSREIARTLGGEAYLPQLPATVKDANDWLAQYHANKDDALAMLNKAEHWLAAEIHRAANLEGLAR